MQEDMQEKSLKNDEYFEYLCRCLEDRAETTNDLQKEGGKAMKKTADWETINQYWEKEGRTNVKKSCENCDTLLLLGVTATRCGSEKCRFLRTLARLKKDGYQLAELPSFSDIIQHCIKHDGV